MVYHVGMSYTVKQLSKLAGISVRTLHYYDEIGLFKPASVQPNGYRQYDDGNLMLLQQILFYRELGFNLIDIKAIVTRPDFDVAAALEAHRLSLQGRRARLDRLIQTVEDTLSHLKGSKKMSQKQLFQAFSDEEQEKYAAEAEQMYDPEIVRTSQKKWKSYSQEDKQRIAEEGNAVYEALVTAIPFGPASLQAQEGVERWRKHMDCFWTPNLEQLVGLTELYNADSRFKANFDKVDPRLATFMLEAVKVYVKGKN